MRRLGGANVDERMRLASENLCKTPAAVEIAPNGPAMRISASLDGVETTCVTDAPLRLLGSRPDCDLALEHAQVSKLHAAVINTGREILVADLCSRMGVFVDGARVQVARLTGQTRLQLGPVSLALDTKAIESAAVTPTASNSTNGEQVDDPLALGHPIRFECPEDAAEVDKLPAVIGRRGSAAIVLDTPDVSLAHALLAPVEGRLMVFDLGSRSGTYLNGELIEQAVIRPGDVLDIGGEELVLEHALGDLAVKLVPSRRSRFTSDRAAAAVAAEAAAQSGDTAFGADADEADEAASDTPAPAAKKSTGRKRVTRKKVPKKSMRRSPAPRPDHDAFAAVDQLCIALRDEVRNARAQLDADNAAFEERKASFSDQIAELESRGEAVAERERIVNAALDQLEHDKQAIAEDRRQIVLQQAAAADAERKLAESRTQLETDCAALAEERRKLVADVAACDQGMAELRAGTEALETQRQEIAAREAATADIEARAHERDAALAAREQEINGREQAFVERERAVNEQAAGFEMREQEIAEREAEVVRKAEGLAAQLADVERRQAELAQRESEDAEARAEIERFRAAFRQASATFSTAGSTPAQPEAPAASSVPASGVTPAAPAGPKPLIARPLFGGVDESGNPQGSA